MSSRLTSWRRRRPAAKKRADASTERTAWRKFLSHPLAVSALVVLTAISIVTIFAPLFTSHDPLRIDITSIRAEPSDAHLFGTDTVGRDVWARTLYGGRVSLVVGFGAVAVAIAIGTLIGTVAGFYGGIADQVLMRITDVALSMPSMLTIVVFVSIVGASLRSVLIVIALLSWPSAARLVRGQFLAIKGADFVTAATVIGVRNRRIILHHVLPNTIGPLTVLATFEVGAAILTETGLSFLGLGVPPPTASWGTMVGQARAPNVLITMWWAWVPPSVAIGLTVLSINLLGDGLRDALDPRALVRKVKGGKKVDASPRTKVREPERATSGADEPLIAADDLWIRLPTFEGVIPAVRGISFTLEPGKVLGLVGESGSGKTMTGLALGGLVPIGTVTGSVRFNGSQILSQSEAALSRIRGAEIGFVFQDPLSSLNPVKTVGNQVAEMLVTHQNLTRPEAKARSIELLESVQIPEPEQRFGSYPHQLSGGMRQRAMIATAISCGPKLVVADEPTTALDVTIQAQILDLLDELSNDLDLAILLISHDIAVVSQLADRIAVMYAGEIVEIGPADTILNAPSHPYTRALLSSTAQVDDPTLVEPIPGAPPDPLNLPIGCAFAPRCPYAIDRCLEESPVLEASDNGGTAMAACWVMPE